MEAPKLEYDIVCPERGSAKGHAIYVLSGNKFSGRVAMVLGAKNMTMTEVQEARRIGECSPGVLGMNLSMTNDAPQYNDRFFAAGWGSLLAEC